MMTDSIAAGVDCWSDAEHAMLMEALVRLQPDAEDYRLWDWEAVSQWIPSRTPSQIRAYAHQYLEALRTNIKGDEIFEKMNIPKGSDEENIPILENPGSPSSSISQIAEFAARQCNFRRTDRSNFYGPLQSTFGNRHRYNNNASSYYPQSHVYNTSNFYNVNMSRCNRGAPSARKVVLFCRGFIYKAVEEALSIAQRNEDADLTFSSSSECSCGEDEEELNSKTLAKFKTWHKLTRTEWTRMKLQLQETRHLLSKVDEDRRQRQRAKKVCEPCWILNNENLSASLRSVGFSVPRKPRKMKEKKDIFNHVFAGDPSFIVHRKRRRQKQAELILSRRKTMCMKRQKAEARTMLERAAAADAAAAVADGNNLGKLEQKKKTRRRRSKSKSPTQPSSDYSNSMFPDVQQKPSQMVAEENMKLQMLSSLQLSAVKALSMGMQKNQLAAPSMGMQSNHTANPCTMAAMLHNGNVASMLPSLHSGNMPPAKAATRGNDTNHSFSTWGKASKIW
eukprot:g1488.t1